MRDPGTRNAVTWAVVEEADYSDIDVFNFGAWGPAQPSLVPLYPKLRRYLVANGVERLTVGDAVAANLAVEFICSHKPQGVRDDGETHELRNILGRQGAPTFRDRGWKP